MPNTLRLDVDPTAMQPMIQFMDVIGSLDLFRQLPIVKVGWIALGSKPVGF